VFVTYTQYKRVIGNHSPAICGCSAACRSTQEPYSALYCRHPVNSVAPPLYPYQNNTLLVSCEGTHFFIAGTQERKSSLLMWFWRNQNCLL